MGLWLLMLKAARMPRLSAHAGSDFCVSIMTSEFDFHCCKNLQEGMSHQNLDYVRILHNRGYRVTPQRVTILDAICEGEGHSTLGDIYTRARKHDPQIDMSTVYRALELFQTLGLVVSADFDGHEKGYEIAKPQQHHHLICKVCKNEFDIDSQTVNDFYKVLKQEYGYDVTMDHLVLSGICPNCQNAG